MPHIIVQHPEVVSDEVFEDTSEILQGAAEYSEAQEQRDGVRVRKLLSIPLPPSHPISIYPSNVEIHACFVGYCFSMPACFYRLEKLRETKPSQLVSERFKNKLQLVVERELFPSRAMTSWYANYISFSLLEI